MSALTAITIDDLQTVNSVDSLLTLLARSLDWPVGDFDIEAVTFDWSPEDLGIAVDKVESVRTIRQLRPLTSKQPWGIFFVEIDGDRLPVGQMRLLLQRLVERKRAQHSGDRNSWQLDDLLFFVSSGVGDTLELHLVAFASTGGSNPEFRTISWRPRQSPVLHLRRLSGEILPRLAWPADEALDTWRASWRSAFVLRYGESLRSAASLAKRMADVARTLRAGILDALTHEAGEGPFSELRASVNQHLLLDEEPEQFADMCAQTLAYGLLASRISDPIVFGASPSLAPVPLANGFLQAFFETLQHEVAFLEAHASDLESLIADLRVTKVEAILDQFGTLVAGADPIIHFYEEFLRVYDPELRQTRGVYYTPLPVVKFMVRAVNELLGQEFGLPRGLSDTSKVSRNGEQVHRIQILDPAVGTGTFLHEVLRSIIASYGSLASDELRNHVAVDVLPRVFGFELLMAPYAMAHMRLSLSLVELGLAPDALSDGSDAELRIALTNSLEPAEATPDHLAGFADIELAMSSESRRASHIKSGARVTVVIGNPPYSGESANKGKYARSLVDPYKFEGGTREPLKEKNLKWLSDDYVKFISLAERQIASSGEGILAFITNNNYLDAPTFRGMRHHLMTTFDKIYVLDLHGSTKRVERSPDGTRDENVFDIQQGVSILLACRTPGHSGGLADVLRGDLYGSRESKYSVLDSAVPGDIAWEKLDVRAPSFLFTKVDHAQTDSYSSGVKLDEIFALSSVGIVTARDNTTIQFSRSEIEDVVLQFQQLPVEELRTERRLGVDTRDWTVLGAKNDVSSGNGRVRQIAYRPFDYRWTFYSGKTKGFMCMPRSKVMDALAETDGYSLVVSRQQKAAKYKPAFAAKGLVESSYVSNRTGELGYVFPFEFIEGRTADGSAILSPNISEAALRRLLSDNKDWVDRALDRPEMAFDYAYAILTSRSFADRFASQLRSELPVLPLVHSFETFEMLADAGKRLRQFHCLEVTSLSRPLPSSVGTGVWVVGSLEFDEKNGVIKVNAHCRFEGVPAEAFNAEVGAYLPARKWLKDRKGRVLTAAEIDSYGRMLVALAETEAIRAEIEALRFW